MMSDICSTMPRSTPFTEKMFARIGQKSLVNEVLDRVRSLILDGQLAPNSCLPAETTLAKKLGVSRQTVREALRILHGEGLLEIRQGAGIYVRQPSSADAIQPGVLQLILASEDLWEVQELRSVLEPAIAERAAKRASDKDFEKVEEILREMETRASRGDSIFELAWEFHLTLGQAAGNKALSKVINILYQMIRAAEGPIYERHFDPWEEIREHRDLLAAIRKRDTTIAREAMKAHLKSVDDRLRKSLNDHDGTTRGESLHL